MRPARKLANEDDLYQYAVGALARRMRTVAELKRLMRARAAEGSADVIESVIARLKEQRYLNDTAYAQTYAAYRRDNERFGPRRVITDLKARGVHSDVIEKAIAAVYRGQDELQLARAFLRRKRITAPQSTREAARIFRALLRAGFSTKTVLTLLKKWDVEEEVLTAFESEAEESLGEAGGPR